MFFILLVKCTPIFLYDGDIWNFREGILVPSIFWFAVIRSIYLIVQDITRLILKDKEIKLYKLILDKDNTIKGNVKELKTSKYQLSGILFGKRGGNYITKSEDKDGHILVIGGAGSGKSSCIAIPSLMTWRERVFAIDIKGELLEKSKRKAIVFNPVDKNSYGYDPFYLLNESENVSQDSREIALCLIPLSADVKDPFWITSAQNLLTSCIIYFHSQEKSFIETIESIQSIPVHELVEMISKSDNLQAQMFMNQFVGLKQEVLSSIYVELSNNIMIFATDNQLKESLSSEKQINPSYLELGHDVFLQIPEHKLENWKGLLSLIVQQFLKHFESRPDEKATPVLFLLDEFARLGKIESITNGLATLRSKKVHICLLTQSLAQIDVIYGKSVRQVIADNCSYKAILNATDAETQEYFSKIVGTYDKVKFTHSENTEEYSFKKGKGESETKEEKKLIKPEEFAYLKDIVLITPFGYMRVDKDPYYKK